MQNRPSPDQSRPVCERSCAGVWGKGRFQRDAALRERGADLRALAGADRRARVRAAFFAASGHFVDRGPRPTCRFSFSHGALLVTFFDMLGLALLLVHVF